MDILEALKKLGSDAVKTIASGNSFRIDPKQIDDGIKNIQSGFNSFLQTAPKPNFQVLPPVQPQVRQPKFIPPQEASVDTFLSGLTKAIDPKMQALTKGFQDFYKGAELTVKPGLDAFSRDFQQRLNRVNQNYIEPASTYVRDLSSFAGIGPLTPEAARHRENFANKFPSFDMNTPEGQQQAMDMALSFSPAGMTKVKPIARIDRTKLSGQALNYSSEQLAKWKDSGQKGLEFMEEMGREAKKQFVKWQQPKQPTAPVNVDDLKDMSGFSAGFRDVFRNFQKVYGKRYTEVKQTLLDPFDQAKGQFVKENETWAKALSDNVVKKFSIHKGTKESAAIQQFGEGLRDYPSLVKEFGDLKAKQIVESDKFFRSAYDQLLDEVNRVRKAIYPSDPEKIIPRRRDYYRHFKEMAEGFQGLANVFDTPANIDSTLAGISYRTEPKSRFLSFAQKRKGDWTTQDAVGGFIDYVKSANYSKFIDPQIGKFRDLADSLAASTTEGTKEPGKLNNFILFLNRFADDLSGKTNPLDRTLQEWIPGGRTSFKALAWLNSRVKANVILGNVKSSVAQIFNVPQSIGSAGIGPSIKGFGRAVAGMFDSNNAIKESTFIAERYSKAFDQFDRGLLANPKRFAVWMTQVLDEAGTNYIWQSHYAKALAEGIANPIKYADDLTRNMVAGRGIGEVPLAQKSKVFQIVAPFQLEIGNLWWVLKDFVDEKAFGKLAKFAVASYVFNRAAEQIRGSSVSFDPLEAMVDAFKTFREEENKGTATLKAGGRIAGEVLSNVPFGQSVAAVYPQYGFKVGDKQMLTRKEFFGREDPTRFGTGLAGVIGGGLQDPLYKVLPPFGGQQIKRMVEGAQAIREGGDYTQSGNLRFPVSPGLNQVIMGPSAGDRAGVAPLGEKQTAQYVRMINQGVSPERAYSIFEKKRELQKLIDEKKKELESKKTKVKPEIDFSIQDLLPQLVKKAGAADAEEQSLITQLYMEEKAESEKHTNINDIYSLGLGKTERDKTLSVYGIDPQEAETYIVKNLGVANGARPKVIKETLKGLSNADYTKKVLELAENKILTDEVLNYWLDQGQITKDQKKTLNRVIDYTKGRADSPFGSAPKPKLLPVRAIGSSSVPKISPITIKTPKLPNRIKDFQPLTVKKPEVGRFNYQP